MTGTRISDMDVLPLTSLGESEAMVPVVRDGQNYQFDLAAMLTVVTPEQYGAIGDGVADDRAAIQAASDALGLLGGGIVKFREGATYRCVITDSTTDAISAAATPLIPSRGLVIQDDVKFSGKGATINLECTGDCYGIRLRNRSEIDGPVVAVVSSTAPGYQGIWHSCISAGDAYSLGGTVGAVSRFHTVSGWQIHDVTLANDVLSPSIAIVLYGGVHDGVIDGVTVGDSATLYGVVHMDWGFVGTISTSGETPALVAAAINASRVNFDAGTAYTTHPHDIIIRNLNIGNQSLSVGVGSVPVRISGGHSITVENVSIDGCTTAGFYQHAGDPGYEFAQAAVKPYRHKRIVVRDFTVRDANNGYGFFADCDADNIATANNVLNVSSVVGTFVAGETITGGTSGVTANIIVGGVGATWLAVQHRSGNFTAAETVTGGTSGATATFGSVAYAAPLLDPVQRVDIVLENCQTFSDGGASVNAGFRLQRLIGATLINPTATGHLQGILIEEGGDEVKTLGGLVYSNRRQGFYAGHGSDRPQHFVVEGLRSFQNDTSGTGLGNIGLENCDNGTIRGCVLGKATETATYGLRAAGTVTGLIVEDNRVEAGTNGYSFGSAGDYSILRRFIGNSCASGVTTKLTGVEIVTEDTILGTDGVARRHCFATRAALSSDVTPMGGGAWVAGERIRYLFDAAGGAEGSICTTSGTAGTTAVFKKYGVIAA